MVASACGCSVTTPAPGASSRAAMSGPAAIAEDLIYATFN